MDDPPVSFWIKYESSLPTKPEVAEMSSLLRMSRYEVVGRLLLIWAWANEQTETGHARGVTKTFLDELHGSRGFADAMEKVGWLSVTITGLSFPHFDYHTSQSAKTRALATNRKSRARRDMSVTREEKRREEKNIKALPPLPPKKKTEKKPKPTVWQQACAVMKTGALKTDTFQVAWGEWIADRAERHLRAMTLRGVKKQIGELEEMGHDRAIAAIDHSIKKGYQGLFEPSGRGPGTQAPTSDARPKAAPGKYDGIGTTGSAFDYPGGKDYTGRTEKDGAGKP